MQGDSKTFFFNLISIFKFENSILKFNYIKINIEDLFVNFKIDLGQIRNIFQGKIHLREVRLQHFKFLFAHF